MTLLIRITLFASLLAAGIAYPQDVEVFESLRTPRERASILDDILGTHGDRKSWHAPRWSIKLGEGRIQTEYATDSGVQYRPMAEADARMKEIFTGQNPDGSYKYLDSKGVLARGLDNLDLAKFRVLMNEQFGIDLDSLEAQEFSDFLIQEARSAGKLWLERWSFAKERLQSNAHGFVGEQIYRRDEAARKANQIVQLGSPDNKSADIIFKDPKTNRPIGAGQSKVTISARGSLDSGLGDVRDYFAKDSNLLDIHDMKLAIPKDQFENLVKSGILEPNGGLSENARNQQGPRLAEETRRLATSPAAKNPASTANRLSTLIKSGEDIDKFCMQALDKTTVVPMSKTYQEILDQTEKWQSLRRKLVAVSKDPGSKFSGYLKNAALEKGPARAKLIGGGTGVAIGALLILDAAPRAWTEIEASIDQKKCSTDTLLRLGEQGSKTLAGVGFMTQGTTEIAEGLATSEATLVRLSTMGKWAGQAAWAIAAIAEVFVIAEWQTGRISDRQFVMHSTSLGGGLGGGFLGAAGGAALGVALGWETGPGVILFAAGGALMGGYAASKATSALAETYYSHLDDRQKLEVEAAIYGHYNVQR